MVNDVWGERWRGDWELVLLMGDGHAGEVLVLRVLPEEMPMVLVPVLLVCR